MVLGPRFSTPHVLAIAFARPVLVRASGRSPTEVGMILSSAISASFGRCSRMAGRRVAGGAWLTITLFVGMDIACPSRLERSR